jgi:hypothetical protein
VDRRKGVLYVRRNDTIPGGTVMAQDSGRSRFASDFTTDDIQHAVETITNGIWIPVPGIQFSRMSRLSTADTGPRGELVEIIPFALTFKAPSFIPSSVESKINSGRSSAGRSGGESFCFSISADADTLEHTTHNALVRLSKRITTGYVSPLFFRRKNLNALRRSGIQSLEKYNINDKNGFGIGTNSLVSGMAFIQVQEEIEKSESQLYVSYTKNGDAVLHLEGRNEKLACKPFLLSDELAQIIMSKNEDSLEHFAEDIIEIIPELFGQSWSSRKIRYIVESALHEHLDETEIPASASLQKAIEHLSPVEKIIVAEKVLRTHLGIVLYFKIAFKS